MASVATQRPQAIGNHFPSALDGQNQSFQTVASQHEASKNVPRDVATILNYFKDNEDGSPPAPTYVGKPEAFNRPTIPQQVTVHDIRGSEEQYSLDRTGFQVVKHESKEKDFLDDDTIRQIYYPETEELLQKVTGASKVMIFDHTIRRQALDSRSLSLASHPGGGQQPPPPLRGPVQRVHIDQSYRAGPDRVKHHLPGEAAALLQGRYQIVNVWRPIKTILRDPLGVADANSVSEDDLVPIKLIYPQRAGETFAVRASRAHRWHYLHRQSPEEVLLIKCFDSKVDGRARRAPHSAFVDQEYEGESTRESIEIRALVFHESDRD